MADGNGLRVVECPICGALEGHKCVNRNGNYVPNHPERLQRWMTKYDREYRVEPEGGFFRVRGRG